MSQTGSWCYTGQLQSLNFVVVIWLYKTAATATTSIRITEEVITMLM